jgi:hypothetical protein
MRAKHDQAAAKVIPPMPAARAGPVLMPLGQQAVYLRKLRRAAKSADAAIADVGGQR